MGGAYKLSVGSVRISYVLTVFPSQSTPSSLTYRPAVPIRRRGDLSDDHNLTRQQKPIGVARIVGSGPGNLPSADRFAPLPG